MELSVNGHVLSIGQLGPDFMESVVGAFKNVCAAEEILLRYPSLNLTDIYAVIKVPDNFPFIPR